MKPVRAKLSFSNNRIRELRKGMGLSPPKAAKAAGVAYQVWLAYEHMRRSPVSSKAGDWFPSAKKIAAFFGEDPNYLWPEAMQELIGVTVVRLLDEQEVLAYSKSQETLVIEQDSVTKALAQISARSRKIVTRRAEGDEFHHIGRDLGLSQERVRQLNEKALRDMRGTFEEM